MISSERFLSLTLLPQFSSSRLDTRRIQHPTAGRVGFALSQC